MRGLSFVASSESQLSVHSHAFEVVKVERSAGKTKRSLQTTTLQEWRSTFFSDLRYVSPTRLCLKSFKLAKDIGSSMLLHRSMTMSCWVFYIQLGNRMGLWPVLSSAVVQDARGC